MQEQDMQSEQEKIDDRTYLKIQATWSNKYWRSSIWSARLNTSYIWLELARWWRIVHDLFQWTMWKVKSKFILHKEPEHRRRIGEVHVDVPSNKSYIFLCINHVEDQVTCEYNKEDDIQRWEIPSQMMIANTNRIINWQMSCGNIINPLFWKKGKGSKWKQSDSI